MDIVIIAVCCVIVVELLLYTRFVSAVRDIKLVYNKTTYVLGSKAISDHWKEKALKKYAGNIFLITLRILLKLVIIFSPFIAAILIAEHTSSQIDRIIYTPWGIIGTTVFAAGYGIVRKNISKSDYGFFDREHYPFVRARLAFSCVTNL